MSRGRILGLDFGLKRVGFAVSDFEHKIALPIGMIENKGYESVILELRKICDKYEVERIVFGKPIGLSANKTSISNKIKEFSEIAGKRLKMNIDFIDERFTTLQAGKFLHAVGMREKRQRSVRDVVSAGILLQTYLDKLNAKRDK